MLTVSEVPEEVAARVLALPGARRAVAIPPAPAAPGRSGPRTSP
jgi:hypothetical protein